MRSNGSSSSSSILQKDVPLASVREVMSFFDSWESKILSIIGCGAAVLHGLVFPFVIVAASNGLSAMAVTDVTIEGVRSLSIKIFIIAIFGGLFGIIESTALEISSTRAMITFRSRWFASLLHHSHDYYDKTNMTEVASIIGPNSIKIRRALGKELGDGLQFLTVFLFSAAFGFFLSWRVAILVICFMPLMAVAFYFLIRMNRRKSADAAKAYSRAGGVAFSTVSNIRTILSLNAVTLMIEQYKDATEEAYNISVSALWKRGLALGLAVGTPMLLNAFLCVYGVSLIYDDIKYTGCDPSGGIHGNIKCSESVISIIGALFSIVVAGVSMSQIVVLFGNMSNARAACYPAILAMNNAATEAVAKRRSDSFLREIGIPCCSSNNNNNNNNKNKQQQPINSKKVIHTDTTNTNNNNNSNNNNNLIGTTPLLLPPPTLATTFKPNMTVLNGSVSFKNVSFAYPTRPNHIILEDFNLQIHGGTTVALVGSSGSGKSTIVALLERFYEPTTGSIELDGVDIKTTDIESFRSYIAYVGQEPVLFSASITANIQYGRSDATKEEIIEAAKLANAHDFIMDFPQGYETQVGSGGGQLSGGQKQRIAIARALVANPKILLLDEATSALDSESEIIVQDALDNLMGQEERTMIVVAHRLSTIQNADSIIVLEHGRVMESGKFDDLISISNGRFKRLFDSQTIIIGGNSGGDNTTTKTNKQMQNGHTTNRSGSSSSTPTTTTTTTTTKITHDEIEESSMPTTTTTTTTSSTTTPTTSPRSEMIKFQNVRFAYPTRSNTWAVNSLTLSVRRGETLALVGPSGGGKSSIMSLIERFYDPSEGYIEFGNVDIRNLHVSKLRNQIGYVGQEPTLFSTTIAKNIAYGCKDCPMEDIEHAAKLANAHDFINAFPDGYSTEVGENGNLLSGGQKQRIAIARALVKNPKVLLLDEATSALDSDSEKEVQAALDRVMAAEDRTTIVIAHRLSTIANVDRIAFVANGKVMEIGTHDELISKESGDYRRLFEAQRRCSFQKNGQSSSTSTTPPPTTTTQSTPIISSFSTADDRTSEDDEEQEKRTNFYFLKKAFSISRDSMCHLIIAIAGSFFVGGTFPGMGVLLAETINLFFTRVYICTEESIPGGFDSCEDYHEFEADSIRERSHWLASYWVVLVFFHIVGRVMTFREFGIASEQVNRRVRMAAFFSLVRQEVAYFDKRNVGSITDQLQDDTTKIFSLFGDPLASLSMGVTSVLLGLTVCFIVMWPFAVVTLALLPLVAIVAVGRKSIVMGTDEGDDDRRGRNNSAAIIFESLLNMRTVSALSIEKQRYLEYMDALKHEQPNIFWSGFRIGLSNGASTFVRQTARALQIFAGGWFLCHYQDRYTVPDLMTAIAAMLLSMIGIDPSSEGIRQRKECEKSALRIFALINRQSAIDPLAGNDDDDFENKNSSFSSYLDGNGSSMDDPLINGVQLTEIRHGSRAKRKKKEEFKPLMEETGLEAV